MEQTLAHKRMGATVATSAFTFVMMMGVVNLFADLTCEGASSINGPFLGALGASAAAIGIIAGVGEFLGYSIRLVAGYISNRTGRGQVQGPGTRDATNLGQVTRPRGISVQT